jgi:GGDEF domain-containing protein
MVSAVVAACAVLAACGLFMLALRRARIRSDRRMDAILLRIDAHLEAMSTGVARSVDAVADIGSARPPLALTLDFDELVDSIVAEAAARTRADAVVLRIEGPGGRPVVASFGGGVESEALDRAFGPPTARRFDVALIDWTYSPSGDVDDAAFQSALVTPLADSAGVPGTLAAYALAREAFRPEQAASIRSLLRDVAVALSNARRFAEMEARVNVDPATGIPNRRGYDHELGREVARATRSGRPLSVVLVGVGVGAPGTETSENGGVGEVARLVERLTRRSDISCRRGDRELAVLLPGTEAAGAAVLTKRIEEEATRILPTDSSSVTVGLVEHQPSETSAALDARIDRTFGARGAVSALDDARNASTAVASTVRSSLSSGSDHVRPELADPLRRDALLAVAGELVEARRYGRSLALAALQLSGLEDLAERHGREHADTTLAQIAGRFDRSLGTGSVHRLGANTFALVLPGAGIHEAEALVEALQSSLEPPHDESGLVLSAGITEFAEADDAEAGLGRTEHALWQASQAGPGTVVVAVPGKRPLPPN